MYSGDLLKPCLDFVVLGFESIRQDSSEKSARGCATFVRSDVQYQQVEVKSSLECLLIRVWEKDRWIDVIHVYRLSEMENTLGFGVRWLWRK